jgi:hypothetical protein
MKYSVTMMNSRGKEVKIPMGRAQARLGLAIAYAHKQLSLNKSSAVAIIREVSLGGTSKVVKTVSPSDRYTSVLK